MDVSLRLIDASQKDMLTDRKPLHLLEFARGSVRRSIPNQVPSASRQTLQAGRLIRKMRVQWVEGRLGESYMSPPLKSAQGRPALRHPLAPEGPNGRVV